jgi:SAM-dependent methyltransferase
MRPSSEDVANYWNAANDWIQMRGAPRVLLLGVTPELYNLPWPKGTDFMAVDSSQAMIDAVWPGPKDAVRCADWLSSDFPEGSRDIVLCDGGLHLLKHPQEQEELIRFIHHTLSHEGLCIFRLFASPAQKESPDVVIQDLVDGKIGSLDCLKLRLSMSLHKNAEEGVALAQVYDTLIKAVPDLEKLALKIGWPVECILAIKWYEGRKHRYYWVTVEEAIDLFCGYPGGFQLHQLRTAPYELGQRCPTIALQRCSCEKTGEGRRAD